MRRRVLLMVAAVTALTVGTVLVLLLVVVRTAVDQSWQSRTDDGAKVAAAAVAEYEAAGKQVTLVDLSALTRASAQVRIRLSDGQVLQTGPIPADQYFISTATAGGVEVTTAIPRATADARFASVMTTVCVCGLVAFAVGMTGAWLYSRRLTRPLLALAATAGRLSTGDRRRTGERYGIAELDAIAEVIDRGVLSFNQALETERQLTADVSHQLRTPLTALSLRLEEIVESDDLAVAHDEAARALEQVERLAGVSEHLVAVARGGRSPSRTPFEVDRLVDDALTEWSPLYAAAGRALQRGGEPGLVAAASFGAQSQVLATLVENSLRHGAGATSVRTRASGGWVVVEVHDEGPGVDQSLVPHVFERHVTTDPDRGEGLGLTLARTLAAADGGRLELLSSAPAVFALFLPARPDPGTVAPSGDLQVRPVSDPAPGPGEDVPVAASSSGLR